MRANRLKVTSLTALTLIGTMMTGCGGSGGDSKDAIPPQGAAPAPASEVIKAEDAAKIQNVQSPAPEATKKITLKKKAEYAPREADVLIVRDNGSAIDGYVHPFKYRLYQGGFIEGQRAFQELGVRLYFTPNVQVGFLNASYNPDHYGKWDPKNDGELIAGPEGASPILAPSSQASAFVDQMMARARIDGENGRYTTSGYGWDLRPLHSIRELIKRSKLDGSKSKGMLRDGKFLSILFIGYADERREAIETKDVIDALDQSRGAGNWMVSVLSPPREGCEWNVWDDTKRTFSGTKVHTNVDPAALGYKTYAEIPADAVKSHLESTPRMAKMIKLQEYSKGLFQNLCEDSYVDFMKSFATVGTKNAFFETKIEGHQPIESSLKVHVNGSPVEGWKYLVASKTLLLPTSIASGVEYEVSFDVEVKADERIVEGPSESVHEIPATQPKKVNPAETEFAARRLGEITGAKCGACHNNYRSFDGFYADRAKVRDRITRPENDPLRMPRGGSLSETELATLLKWIDDFP